MSTNKKHLVTCALPYANGPLHIGHLAGCFLPSDIYVRYLRNAKKEVLFVCGTDEHGVPITLQAKKKGVTPQDVVDENYTLIRDSLEKWGIGFDNFSRTTRPIHHETAKAFFKTLYDNGVFVEQVTEQYYDEESNQFLADRYITGDCPHCKHQGAYGDQCENCGRTLSPSELINPKSALTGNSPVKKETKNWFLPLDTIQASFLNEWVATKKDVWKSHVYGQCMSWLNDGLKPRAMTRDLDWGVKVPIEGADGKVMYVWFDAPIGYISATKECTDDWKSWWQNPEAELTHFLGKDNIVFHTIIFPAMLKAHGDFNLPTHVPANEFLNLEGEKLSTSRNHAVWLHEYLNDFPGKEDELRYVLTSIMPETKDSDFSWADFQARVNNELVAILGNWVNRVMVLTHKYFDGVVPANENKTDYDVLESARALEEKVGGLIEEFKFRDGLAELMAIARLGNKYLQDTAPWHAIKEENGQERVKEILNVSLQLLALFAKSSIPFLPHTSGKLTDMLQLKPTGLMAGQQVNKPTLLFAKIEDEEILKQKERLENQAQENAEAPELEPIKPTITFDDFSKLDFRVGTIVEAAKVPKADKLLQLLVDIGLEKRTILSGIAQHFSPEDLVGKQAVVVTNLAPRKMRGVESNGMLLMAENTEGKLVFVEPVGGIEPGSVVR
ncbi:MAG: methionine--tRNA ligase [Bacteroidetes bacterium]|jgi:methionyl-tRNA synthetase|nr:methionine--tRNA ligase [Bacteroidota bacterium]